MIQYLMRIVWDSLIAYAVLLLGQGNITDFDVIAERVSVAATGQPAASTVLNTLRAVALFAKGKSADSVQRQQAINALAYTQAQWSEAGSNSVQALSATLLGQIGSRLHNPGMWAVLHRFGAHSVLATAGAVAAALGCDQLTTTAWSMEEAQRSDAMRREYCAIKGMPLGDAHSDILWAVIRAQALPAPSIRAGLTGLLPVAETQCELLLQARWQLRHDQQCPAVLSLLATAALGRHAAGKLVVDTLARSCMQSYLMWQPPAYNLRVRHSCVSSVMRWCKSISVPLVCRYSGCIYKHWWLSMTGPACGTAPPFCATCVLQRIRGYGW